MKILYIEDDQASVQLMGRILRSQHHRMLHAADGRVGLAMVAREKPDMIFMDFNLPGINGIQANFILQSIHHVKHIPIIAITASADANNRHQFLDNGFTAVMYKPIDVPEVLQLLEKFTVAAGR